MASRPIGQWIVELGCKLSDADFARSLSVRIPKFIGSHLESPHPSRMMNQLGNPGLH